GLGRRGVRGREGAGGGLVAGVLFLRAGPAGLRGEPEPAGEHQLRLRAERQGSTAVDARLGVLRAAVRRNALVDLPADAFRAVQGLPAAEAGQGRGITWR